MRNIDDNGVKLLAVAVVCKGIEDARSGSQKAMAWLRDEGTIWVDTILPEIRTEDWIAHVDRIQKQSERRRLRGNELKRIAHNKKRS